MTLMVFGLLLTGLVLLIVGGDLLVRGASQLAAALGVSSVVIGLTVVAFGTSAPELAVSLAAAFKGNANIAVANVVGSNIFNVLFILGISSLISPLVIHSQIIRREVPILVLVSLGLLAASYNLNISRGEGLFFFTGILAYTYWLVRETQQAKKQEIKTSSAPSTAPHKMGRSIGILLLGLAMIMVGGEFLVQGAIATAKSLGVSDRVIGLTIVAIGTSLPEVVASIAATLKGERDIAVGNVIGSNLYNILAILGISASITPTGLNVDPTAFNLDLPAMVLAAALCWPFFRSDSRLSRPEGAIFLALYLIYTWLIL